MVIYAILVHIKQEILKMLKTEKEYLFNPFNIKNINETHEPKFMNENTNNDVLSGQNNSQNNQSFQHSKTALVLLL